MVFYLDKSCHPYPPKFDNYIQNIVKNNLLEYPNILLLFYPNFQYILNQIREFYNMH